MNAWFRGVLLWSSVFILVGWSISAQESAETSELIPAITSDEAINYVGKKATVCGVVVEAVYLSHSQRKLTFLNFDQPHPDQAFDVVIEEADRAKFTQAPEDSYKGKKICVTGLVNEFKGKAQMNVTDPGQIAVTETAEVPAAEETP